MNYLEPELLAVLTERYVLGTMSRRARRRYSQVMEKSTTVQSSVYALEKVLLPIAWSLPPVRPSALVWPRIVRAAGFGQQTRRQPARRRAGWPLATAAMTGAFLLTTLGWWQSSSRDPEIITETVVETVPLEPSIAVIVDDTGSALWVARIYPDLLRAELSVRTLPEQQSDHDYELWVLRDDGVPVSLGLMPQQGARSLTLADSAIDALRSGSTLAVSLEPLGGSPKAAPTGPVLYTTALLPP